MLGRMVSQLRKDRLPLAIRMTFRGREGGREEGREEEEDYH